jgi:hypothetical protein
MRLQHILATVIIILFSSDIMAQENQNEYRSIFNKKADQKVSHGGYGAFGVGYTEIDGKEALLLNVKGAWVINHHIALGLAGTGFFNNLDKSSNTNEHYLGGGYGGFYFEPIIFPKSPMHLSFPILIGAGGITSIPHNYWGLDWDNVHGGYDYDVFFVVEPGVELEFNMVKFFRIAVGASYRLTNGVVLNYSADNAVPVGALDGFNFYLNFKFGKF